MLFCLSACTSANTPSGKGCDDPNLGTAKPDDTYASVVAKGFSVENNLKIETIFPPFNNEDQFNSYIIIDGLADSALQERINARLKSTFDEMINGDYIPPYRGIKQQIRGTDGGRVERNAYMVDTFNRNGLLSIVSTGSIIWYDADGDYAFSCSYEEPVVFDLATGNELSLSDLFLKDTNYIEYLSSEMDTYLMQNGFDNTTDDTSEEFIEDPPVSLVAPFTGVKPGQKFFINYDGDPVLVMDYDTPEFVLDYRPRDIYLPHSTCFIPASTGKNIFTDSSIVYNLPNRETDSLKAESVYKTVTTDDGLEISCDYRYNTGLPEVVITKIHEICSDASFPTDMKEFKKRAKAAAGGRKWEINLSRNGYFNVAADYTSLIVMQQADAILSDEYSTILNFSIDKNYCFIGNDPEPLEYSSIFKQPERAQELTANVIADKLTQAGFDAENINALADLLVKHISGFCMYTDSVCISFDIANAELEKLINEALGVDENLYAYISQCSNIDFRSLGCENLTLFDDLA